MSEWKNPTKKALIYRGKNAISDESKKKEWEQFVCDNYPRFEKELHALAKILGKLSTKNITSALQEYFYVNPQSELTKKYFILPEVMRFAPKRYADKFIGEVGDKEKLIAEIYKYIPKYKRLPLAKFVANEPRNVLLLYFYITLQEEDATKRETFYSKPYVKKENISPSSCKDLYYYKKLFAKHTQKTIQRALCGVRHLNKNGVYSYLYITEYLLLQHIPTCEIEYIIDGQKKEDIRLMEVEQYNDKDLT